MVDEARLEQTDNGKSPTTDGWFVLHVAEAPWLRSERFGRGCRVEGDTRFPEIGFNLRVLDPGKPACLYHRENAQEDFLVLSGECTLVVEEQERHLRAGHFVHCPAETNHVFVGAGDGPCVVLMIGRRPEQAQICYQGQVPSGQELAQADSPFRRQGRCRIIYGEPLPISASSSSHPSDLLAEPQ